MSERDSGEFPLTFTDDRAPSNGDAEAREIQLAYNGLKIAWINERAAPEILPYQPHIVDKLKLAIDEEQDRLLADQSSGLLSGPQSITNQIKQLEIDRIRFMLSAYLRTRLKKVEHYVMKILLTNHYFECLSEPEQQFAKQYVDLLAQHFEDSFLNQIPERVRTLDDVGDGGNNMIEEPSLEKHVFFRITQSVGPFIVRSTQDEDQINLEMNDIVLGRYSAFKVLLESDQGQLI